MLGLLHNHRLTYRRRWDVEGDVTAFEFAVEGHLNARAGQHMVVAASTSLRKPFSLASAPEEEFAIIATSLRSGSAFKTRLAALGEGEHITARGPVFTYFKPFVLEPDASSKAVLLAQGIGVSPFRSMLGHLAMTGGERETHLIHVASEGHPFRQDTTRWATQATYPTHAADFREAARSDAERDTNSTFFVAGAPSFTSSTIGFLRGLGVARSRIRDDPYLFYKPTSGG